MLLHLVSPEESLAAEASGRGGAVQGRPVLLKRLHEWQYLHDMMGADRQLAQQGSLITSPQNLDATGELLIGSCCALQPIEHLIQIELGAAAARRPGPVVVVRP